jgi:hypothetical protein
VVPPLSYQKSLELPRALNFPSYPESFISIKT